MAKIPDSLAPAFPSVRAFFVFCLYITVTCFVGHRKQAIGMHQPQLCQIVDAFTVCWHSVDQMLINASLLVENWVITSLNVQDVFSRSFSTGWNAVTTSMCDKTQTCALIFECLFSWSLKERQYLVVWSHFSKVILQQVGGRWTIQGHDFNTFKM